jgi:hypothetical protein
MAIRSELKPHSDRLIIATLSQGTPHHSLEVEKVGSDLMGVNHPFDFQEGAQKVKMGHQEIVGILRDLVVLCGAFGVDLQRTSRKLSC